MSIPSEQIKITGEPEHLKTVAQFLADDFDGPQRHCDVQFRFGSHIVSVHSNILTAFSQSFALEFSRPYNKIIDLSFLDRESVLRVLYFIYHGHVVLDFHEFENDLETIAYFGVSRLQVEVEKKVLEMAKNGKIVDILNRIPHSSSTILATSDETVSDLVNILHNIYSSGRLSHEDILQMTSNTIITVLSSRIIDIKKIDIINISLKWISERQLNNNNASKILEAVTLGSMTYSQLINFRLSLADAALPVLPRKNVRLNLQGNSKIEIQIINSVFFENDHKKMTFDISPLINTDPTVNSATSSRSATFVENTELSTSYHFNLDDCSTAISFDDEDLKRLGFENKHRMMSAK